MFTKEVEKTINGVVDIYSNENLDDVSKDQMFNNLINKMTGNLEEIFEKESMIERKIESNLTLRKVEKNKLKAEIDELNRNLSELENYPPQLRFKNSINEIQSIDASNKKLEDEIKENEEKLTKLMHEQESKQNEVQTMKKDYEQKLADKQLELNEAKMKQNQNYEVYKEIIKTKEDNMRKTFGNQ